MYIYIYIYMCVGKVNLINVLAEHIHAKDVSRRTASTHRSTDISARRGAAPRVHWRRLHRPPPHCPPPPSPTFFLKKRVWPDPLDPKP